MCNIPHSALRQLQLFVSIWAKAKAKAKVTGHTKVWGRKRLIAKRSADDRVRISDPLLPFPHFVRPAMISE